MRRAQERGAKLTLRDEHWAALAATYAQLACLDEQRVKVASEGAAGERAGDLELLREERAKLTAQVAAHEECVRTVQSTLEAEAHQAGDSMQETLAALAEGTRLLEDQMAAADQGKRDALEQVARSQVAEAAVRAQVRRNRRCGRAEPSSSGREAMR